MIAAIAVVVLVLALVHWWRVRPDTYTEDECDE